MSNPSPGHESARPALDRHCGSTLALISLAVDVALDVLLNHDAAIAETLGSQLLHVGHLTGSEEQLGLAKAIFILIVDELGDDIFTRCPEVIFADVFGVAEDSVAEIEVIVGPPGRVAGRADADSLEDAAGAELLHSSLRVELEGRFLVIGLDASDVVWSR